MSYGNPYVDSGDIKFHKDARVLLVGCHLAEKGFAKTFARVTSANVIAAKGKTYQIYREIN